MTSVQKQHSKAQLIDLEKNLWNITISNPPDLPRHPSGWPRQTEIQEIKGILINQESRTSRPILVAGAPGWAAIVLVFFEPVK